MKSTPSGKSSPPIVFDIKPYVRHDPLIGYRYIPLAEETLPRPGGGHYTIRINAQGIRSDREYTPQKPPGIFRVVVCGDSFAAGQYVSNNQRFSELLERRIPNLEVINIALEGTGTDQQLLLFEEFARSYEFDLVLLFPFLQNISRNLADSRTAYDPKTHQEILRPKPRFELVNGKLELRNVPVTDQPILLSTADERTLRNSDRNQSLQARIKAFLQKSAAGRSLKRFANLFFDVEPFPEYRNSSTPAWQLMAAIIRRFKESAGDKPLVIVPVFYSRYLRQRTATNYLDRFRSLTQIPGIHVIDMLPYFRRLGEDGWRAFLDPYDCHYSPQGNLVVADILQAELSQLKLLP
ncbi:MAG: SGNH/GDSL hydrolase family protein [Phycisphaeraceae bacterium]|nr:SGNH/GDSL hydrolase family protein [Phycisphaeraceae bacterium]